MQERAKEIVREYYWEEHGLDVPIDEIFIVWFCETLKNWKCMASTPQHDIRYFEITFNGERNQIYLDCYVKEANRMIQE